MTTQAQVSSKAMNASVGMGANIVALAGVGLIVYGLMFLVRNFTGFTELGLTPEHVGGTPEQIQGFSQNLYNYISHLQVALSGFIVALGVAVIALALFGIRRGGKLGVMDSVPRASDRSSHRSALALSLSHRHTGPPWVDLSGCNDLAGWNNRFVSSIEGVGF